jgi:hypothetical protein
MTIASEGVAVNEGATSLSATLDPFRGMARVRGFDLATQEFEGEGVKVVVQRVAQGPGRRYNVFEDAEGAAAFLRDQPELPSFKVRIHFTQGGAEVYQYHDVDAAGALNQAIRDGSYRSKPGYVMTSLEVVR